MPLHSASCICIETISNYRRPSALSRCKTICSVILDHVVFQVLSCAVFCTTMFAGLPFAPCVKLLMCSEHTPVVKSLVAVIAIEPCRESRPRQRGSPTTASHPSPSRISIVRHVRRIPRVPSGKLGEIVSKVFFLHQRDLVLLQTSFLFQLRGVGEDGTDKTLGRIHIIDGDNIYLNHIPELRKQCGPA